MLHLQKTLHQQRFKLENHYKTVKHQLECKKMRALEEVKKTNPEAEIKKYRKNLLEITHFKAPEYRPRRWLSKKTKNISLESEEILKDPRILKCKMPTDTEMPKEKTCKPCEDPKLTACSNYKEEEKTQNIQNIPENPTDPTSTVEEVILHVTDSELNLFQDITEDPTNAKIIEDCTTEQDKRRVYLNNNWQVKDSIGSPAFQGIIEEDPNIDWLTFISDNINF